MTFTSFGFHWVWRMGSPSMPSRDKRELEEQSWSVQERFSFWASSSWWQSELGCVPESRPQCQPVSSSQSPVCVWILLTDLFPCSLRSRGGTWGKHHGSTPGFCNVPCCWTLPCLISEFESAIHSLWDSEIEAFENKRISSSHQDRRCALLCSK